MLNRSIIYTCTPFNAVACSEHGWMHILHWDDLMRTYDTRHTWWVAFDDLNNNFMSIDEWWYWEELKVNERTHTHYTTCACIIPMCLCRLYTSHGVYTYKFVLGPLPIHCSSSSPGGSLCKPGKCHYTHGAWCQNRRQNTKILPVQTNWKKKANCRQSASQHSFLTAQVCV